ASALLGVIIIVALIVGIGLSIYYIRTFRKNNNPITYVDGVVSPPTPRFNQASPSPQPTAISITEIAPVSPAPRVVSSSDSLPESGPTSSIILFLTFVVLLGGTGYYLEQRSRFTRSVKGITIK